MFACWTSSRLTVAKSYTCAGPLTTYKGKGVGQNRPDVVWSRSATGCRWKGAVVVAVMLVEVPLAYPRSHDDTRVQADARSGQMVDTRGRRAEHSGIVELEARQNAQKRPQQSSELTKQVFAVPTLRCTASTTQGSCTRSNHPCHLDGVQSLRSSTVYRRSLFS